MYESIVNLLENFVLNGDNLNPILYENKFKESPKNMINNFGNDININKNNKKNIFINNDLYNVRQHDSLFWSFYIIKNGIANYEMYASKRYFTIEQEEKFKYIELIRKNKQLLKNNKFKNITNIETELGNNSKISIKIFFVLCLIENLKVILVDGRKIYQNFYENDNNINIIIKNNKFNNYTIDFDNSTEKINKYLNEYLIINSFDDKLKSISSYKVSELIEICEKLNINIFEKNENQEQEKCKKSKQQLYSLISQKYN